MALPIWLATMQYLLALVLNELVTNALKYAYPDKATGKVFVELKASTDQVLLRSD